MRDCINKCQDRELYCRSCRLGERVPTQYQHMMRLKRDSALREKHLIYILATQGNTCSDPLQRCPFNGAPLPEDMAELDHITRVADGGSDDPSNLQVLCACCHAAKTSAEKRANLKKKRPRPTMSEIVDRRNRERLEMRRLFH
tara:strand:+ start:505 stop:933 length:429 start_codon:yes stop_codon:yes gene_type:complete